MLFIIIAYIALIIAAINIFVGPFLIGKPRQPMGGTDYIIQLIFSAIWVALAGVILGWWHV